MGGFVAAAKFEGHRMHCSLRPLTPLCQILVTACLQCRRKQQTATRPPVGCNCSEEALQPSCSPEQVELCDEEQQKQLQALWQAPFFAKRGSSGAAVGLHDLALDGAEVEDRGLWFLWSLFAGFF